MPDWGLTPAVIAALLAVSGCASWPRSWGARPCCIETKPAIRRQPIAWHLFDVTIVSPIKNTANLARLGRRLAGIPKRSVNLHGGEIGDTTFFTNRDPAQLSPDEIRWGPTRPSDVARPPYTITRSKMEGKTAGFFVTDARGAKYLFKLDPAEAPELLSGAEAVTSKLLHALGYHVPSYEVVLVRPEELRVAPDAVTKSRRPFDSAQGGVPSQVEPIRLRSGLDPERSRGIEGRRGHRQPFDEAELQGLIAPHLRHGLLRVSASKLLEGEVLGPAPFKRFRDCAEMRALNVAYAWVNNIDTKDHNSLLVWDGVKTVGYLIDFGTSLGADAGSGGPKDPCAGALNIVDMEEASLKLVTLGLHQPPCVAGERPVSPNVGRFSTSVNPDRWKPYAPNLAFNEMNEDDARWMARRMARLSRAQLEAAVSAGQYSNPEDAAYLVEALDARRLAIIRTYVEDDEEEP